MTPQLRLRRSVGRADPPAIGDSPLRNLLDLGTERVYAAMASEPGGLDDREVGIRLARTGPNRIEDLPGPGLAQRLLGQFIHLLALLLWIAAGLAFAAGMPELGVAIVVVIVLNGIFGLLQEYRAERAVAALRRLLPSASTVLRGGVERQVSAEDLVPGDLLVLNEGDRVSADARVVDAAHLRVDESSLTGESHPVRKTAHPESGVVRTIIHAHNVVFAGSLVMSGSGRAVVAATGMATEFGRIARLTQAVEPEPSPLQIEVARVARRVAILSAVMGIGFFALGSLVGDLSPQAGAIFAIGIVIGNVPEGLLPTMTLSLALGVQRMARRNAIVKRLSSVETLGSCTVICTDKTGTVTKNEITVRELWAAGERAAVTGVGYTPEGEFVSDGHTVRHDLALFLPILRIGQMCSSAHLVDAGPEGGGWRVLGDPTEGALLVVAAKAGLDRDIELGDRPLVRTLAFEPGRKRMSTIHRVPASEGELVAYVKGAPRELIALAEKAFVGGEEVPLTPDLRAAALAENDRMASAGLRVLACAYRYLPTEIEARVGSLPPGEVEDRLVLAGLVGMEDPPREEVGPAVADCRAAGVRIVMITGDYGLTAECIARETGILPEGPAMVLEGADTETLSDDALRRILSSGEVLFARATPEHKLRIVSVLQSMGEVVAVTGDGVNDAPALRQADIGVAMGLAGTDVAREAADMVLVDDNLATIVGAIEEGRAIFDNMRKFIVYIFAHLSPEAIPFILFALFHTPLPLTVMQILAIDLGTETLPALALGTERPEPDVMARPPRRRTESLLGLGSLLRGYAFLGGMTTVIVLTAFFAYLISMGWAWGDTGAPSSAVGQGATTIVFGGIVIMQVANAFACRTERASSFSVGLLSNRPLLWGIAFELALAGAIVYLQPLQAIFGTAWVDPRWWLLPAILAPFVFLAEEARKLLVRRYVRRSPGTEYGARQAGARSPGS